jgi:hypothetical protein
MSTFTSNAAKYKYMAVTTAVAVWFEMPYGGRGEELIRANGHNINRSAMSRWARGLRKS